MKLFIPQSPIDLKYPHAFFIRNKCVQSRKKGRQSKSVPVFERFSEIEKYTISEKENSFLIGKFYQSKSLTW